MRFEKPTGPRINDDNRPKGARRVCIRLNQFTNRMLPREEMKIKSGNPQIKNRAADICHKAYREPDGHIFIPEECQLLRLMIRYLAGKYTLEEMMNISARKTGVNIETVKWMMDRFGEIDPSAISVDCFIGYGEWIDMSPSEKEELGNQFCSLKANNTDAEMITALSTEEMYYVAALRKMQEEK